MAITAASLEVKLATSGAAQVKSDLAGIGGAIDSTAKKGNGFLRTMFGVGGGILGAQIVTGTFRTIKNGIVDMVMGASNLSEAQSKVNVVYGKSSGVVTRWAKTTSRAFGITETAALDTAGTLGNLFTNMGLGTDVAADMSITMTELSGDLSSFFNVSQPEVINAMTSAFVGEYDALQRLGIPINAAAVEQFALNNGIWDGVGAMTEAERAQAVYGLVLENTTNAQGDFARTSDEAANQMRILSATWSELTTRIGGVFLPVANQFLDWAISAVDYAGSLADAWGTGGFGAVIDQITADLSDLVVRVPAITIEILDWLVDTGGDLIGKIREKVIGMIMGGDSGGDGTGGGTYGGITIEQAIKVQIREWAVALLDTDHNGDITFGEVQQAVDNAMEGIIGIDVEVQDGKLKIDNPEGDFTLMDVQGWVDTALEKIIGVDIEIQDGKLKIDNPTNDLTLADVQGWVDEALEGIVGVNIEIQDWNFGFGEVNLDPAFEAIHGVIEDVQDFWERVKNFRLSAPDIEWPNMPGIGEIPFVKDVVQLFADIANWVETTKWSFSVGVPDIDWPNPMDLVPQEIKDFVADPWGWVKDHVGGGDDAPPAVFDPGGGTGSGHGYETKQSGFANPLAGMKFLQAPDFSRLFAGMSAAASKEIETTKGVVSGGMSALTATVSNGAATATSAYASLMALIGPATAKPMMVAQNAVSSGMNAIVATTANGLSTVVSVTTSLMSSARSAVVSAMAQIVQAGASGMASYRNAVQSGMSSAVAAVRSGISAMVGAASGGRGAMASAGVGIGAALGQGIAAGIRGQIGAVAAAASAIVTTAIASARRAGGIASPSKRMRLDVGQPLGLGAVLGVEDLIPRMDATMGRLISIPTIDPYGGRLAAGGYGGSFATAPVRGGDTYYVVVTVPTEEWTNVKDMAVNAPQRVQALMATADSLTVVKGAP